MKDWEEIQKAKEKPMKKEKFMFENEEQLTDYLNNVLIIVLDAYNSKIDFNETRDKIIKESKEKGYIRKSELQTLVDEAELLYWKTVSRNGIPDIEELQHLIDVLKETTDKFKKQYPEYNK